jgi:hypothetical protein
MAIAFFSITIASYGLRGFGLYGQLNMVSGYQAKSSKAGMIENWGA